VAARRYATINLNSRLFDSHVFGHICLRLSSCLGRRNARGLRAVEVKLVAVARLLVGAGCGVRVMEAGAAMITLLVSSRCSLVASLPLLSRMLVSFKP